MLDVLRLQNLVIDCIVGVYPSERSRPQPLQVDLALHLDTRGVATGAGLAGTVDYARLAGELRFLLVSCQFLLLETAAEALCRYLLAPPTDDAPHAAVEEVTLKLSKPAALDGTILPSLEVHRRAAEMSYTVEEKPFGRVDIIHETRACGIYRLRLAPGGCIPTHEHRLTDESELVLGGGLELQGRPVEAGTGFRWPRGVSHRYDNPSATWQTVLCVDRPSFEPTDEVETTSSPLAPSQGVVFFPPAHR